MFVTLSLACDACHCFTTGTPTNFRNRRSIGGTDAQQVSTFDNATYSTNVTAPTYTATWQYDQGPVSEPVHAFPNAKLDLGAIPVQLTNMSSLTVDVEWTYGVGRDVEATGANGADLDAAGMNANVCIDMFVDPVADNSGITNKASYEVMIWLGRYGPATLPIGYLQGVAVILTVNDGTSFDLYFGDNSIGQKVFTWVAQTNTTALDADIAPLVGEFPFLSSRCWSI